MEPFLFTFPEVLGEEVLFEHEGETKTLLQMIQEKNVLQGRAPVDRADVRLDTGPDGRLFLLNKHDGVIRRLVP